MKNPLKILSREFYSLTNSKIARNRYSSSISESTDYVESVIEAVRDDKKFSSFKRDSRYQGILEHVSYSDGYLYLERIKNEYPNLYDKIEDFKINDKFGSPVQFNYPEIGLISPTTLRYVNVLGDLQNLAGKRTLRIAEIGAGYGGQFIVLDKALNIEQYDFYDLDPVLFLIEKYLQNLDTKTKYNLENVYDSKIRQYDLVISNYAFSELRKGLQKTYIKKIISKSKMGYMIMNSGKKESAFQSDKLSLKQLGKKLPKFQIQSELPLTCPGNYVITWNQYN